MGASATKKFKVKHGFTQKSIVGSKEELASCKYYVNIDSNDCSRRAVSSLYPLITPERLFY